MSNLQTKALEEFEKNTDFFESNKKDIQQKYGRKTYVVIRGQKIIDCRTDHITLVERYVDQCKIKGSFIVQNIEDSERNTEAYPRMLPPSNAGTMPFP